MNTAENIQLAFIDRCQRHIWTCVVIATGLVAAYIVNIAIGEPSWNMTRLIDLDGEGNLPTWFSSFLWVLVAGSAFYIAVTLESQGRIQSQFWKIASVIFLGLSCDEVAQLHEKLGQAINKKIFPADLHWSPWVVFLGPFIRLRRRPRVYPWMNAQRVLRRDVRPHRQALNFRADNPQRFDSRSESAGGKIERYHGLARGASIVVGAAIFLKAIYTHLKNDPKVCRKVLLGLIFFLFGGFFLDFSVFFFNRDLHPNLYFGEVAFEEYFEMLGTILVLSGILDYAQKITGQHGLATAVMRATECKE